ncbi:hypothetical protein HPP92_002803 [Vanilla planifolia]|uniref:Uncharacterized protein n=1 Tax=Vanilla planifolia TaxID=51239 RepID=A0A835VGM1_VANPL|nr:hypothetical protein HPP92_002803 [Vanilla planifolia]
MRQSEHRGTDTRRRDKVRFDNLQCWVCDLEMYRFNDPAIEYSSLNFDRIERIIFLTQMKKDNSVLNDKQTQIKKRQYDVTKHPYY